MPSTHVQRPDACELCHRTVAALTQHHLVPRMRHRSKRTRRDHDIDALRRRVAWLCRPCHKQVHALIDEKELAANYDTVERLLRHPDLARFVAWIRGRPDGTRVPAHRAWRRR